MQLTEQEARRLAEILAGLRDSLNNARDGKLWSHEYRYTDAAYGWIYKLLGEHEAERSGLV